MIPKLLLAGLLTVALLPAQRGGGGRGSDESEGAQMPQSVNRLDIMENVLKLTKDQKKEVKTVMDEGQKEAASLRDELAKSEQEIGQAVAGGGAQDQIDKAVNAHAALDTQMVAVEMKAFAKIYKLLDAEQQPKAAPVFFMMQGVFRSRNWNEAK